jgi:hypothetical protein
MDKNNNSSIHAGLLLDSALATQKEIADMESSAQCRSGSVKDSARLQRLTASRKQGGQEEVNARDFVARLSNTRCANGADWLPL